MKVKEVMKWHQDMVVYCEDAKDNLTIARTVGGVTWPGFNSPGYYCMFGQAREVVKNRQPATLLKEMHTENLNDLLAGILEDSRKLLCTDFFADTNTAGDGGAVDFNRAAWDFLEQRGSNVRILPPAVNGWSVAVFRIQQWEQDGVFKIAKESVLGQQLGRMTRESLGEQERPGFFAVNALRCMIADLEDGARGGWGEGLVSEMPPGAWT